MIITPGLSDSLLLILFGFIPVIPLIIFEIITYRELKIEHQEILKRLEGLKNEKTN